MIPLVATRRELELMKAVVDKAAQDVFADKGRTIEYLVGTMIELPRAALRAGEIDLLISNPQSPNASAQRIIDEAKAKEIVETAKFDAETGAKLPSCWRASCLARS